MNLDAQEAALGLLGLSPTNLTPTVSTTIVHSPTSTIPTKRKQRDEADTAGEGIDCICGFEVDDGFSIACDICSRWCHSACFDVAPEEIPEQFKCWTCKPRPPSFKERAVRMQRDRLEMGGMAIVEKQRRKTSPGVERKHRRVSADKRKRRPSMVNEDEHVDIDEPWSQSYVHISQDLISDDETRVKLRRQAHHWRGVTAIADSSPLVKELPPAEMSSYSNPHILPPAYSLHTAAPITSNRLITDYKSSITPSSSYLSDPLNAYAHLGMPKPFVHLFGPPLDVALDSRLVGSHGRFARSGCQPNAVLRPLLCDDSDSLGFGVFALRDLKANEEVVLGWEWDDGNAVHNLPALLKTPHIFPPHQVQHLRHQMSNILHALSSTFTTCACGARAQNCVISRMAAFVDGVPTQTGQQEQQFDLGPLVGRKRGFKTKERIPFSGGMAGMVMCGDNETSLVSTSSPILPGRSLKGKERAIDSDGDGHIEMANTLDKSIVRVCQTKTTKLISDESPRPSFPKRRLKSHSAFDFLPPDPGGPYQHVNSNQPQPENEDNMPPKMRKRWMHRELGSLKELNGNASPSSIQGSNHSHISESPGNSSTSGVSLGSPTTLPNKLAKGSGLDITYNNGYGRDRPQSENGRQEDHDQYYHHREDDVLTNLHHHHPASMPPPPMPAFLDPTTISSTKSSINTNQHSDSPLITLIPPSISPLTSFANLSLLSPALIHSTSPSLPVLLGRPPPNSAMTTATPTVLPRDKNAVAWSSLRRSALPSTSPPLPSSHHNDIGCIALSSSSPLTTIPAHDVDGQPIKSTSCTPSPSPSPSSPQPESLLMDTNDDIQSTPHSPDPTWRADSPSGDHVNPSIGLDIQMDEDRHSEFPVFDVKGDHMDVVASLLSSPSQMSRDTTTSNGDEEEISTTDAPDYMNIDQSNHVTSPSRMEPAPLSDVESPSTSFPLSQPVTKDEELRSDMSQEQEPSRPPPPKVKMSLRDFALRKKKQREEEEMTKSVQDSPTSGGANLSFIQSEGGGLNGKQVDRVGQADGGSSNGKTVVDGIIGVEVKRMDLEEGLVGDLRRDTSYQGASSLSRPVVKDEVVDVPGISIKLTTTNGYYPQPSPSSSSSSPSSPQPSTTFTYPAITRRTKQELIEQPIPTTTIQPTTMDSTRYAAMYNNSRSISPINPDPHHFQSHSPPRLCQEDGEIGEIMDSPLQLPSSPSSLRAAPPAINRSASMTAASGSIVPMPRGPITKRADSAFARPSSSQVRHSPPTHPRSYNASPPYRQQPPSVSTPPPAAVRGTGVPPPTAPRALRQSMLSNRLTPTTSTTMASSSYFSTGSSTVTASPASTTTINGGRFTSYIPRGPSADRDRGWDMDQTQYARSLSRRDSREGGHTWGGR